MSSTSRPKQRSLWSRSRLSPNKPCKLCIISASWTYSIKYIFMMRDVQRYLHLPAPKLTYCNIPDILTDFVHIWSRACSAVLLLPRSAYEYQTSDSSVSEYLIWSLPKLFTSQLVPVPALQLLHMQNSELILPMSPLTYKSFSLRYWDTTTLIYIS